MLIGEADPDLLAPKYFFVHRIVWYARKRIPEN
jgi:hypothetical protein